MNAADSLESTTAKTRVATAARRVTVALSGGVDSAVAALLLRDQGYDVRGLFMKNWEEDDRDGECAAARDLADAERVCERLGLALDTVNFSAEYWERVFQQMLAGYRAGLTPNPDVLCNREVKFGPFLDFALERGAERVATGHYARLAHAADGNPRLLAARDADKDQTYFLCMLNNQSLARVLFPLGDLDKHQVRAIARSAGLAVHDKRDSTGLCFVGPRNFRAFLTRFLTPAPGEVHSIDGRVVGRHRGAALYTLGQRDGLGTGGVAGGSGEPWYVVERDLARNIVYVVQGREHPRLNQRNLRVRDAHWISGAPPSLPTRLAVRIRHRQSPAACEVHALAGGDLRLSFEQPQWAPAPGQAAVFYDADECLGGAWLCAEQDPAMTAPTRSDDSALALAGIFQATALVKQVARAGEPEERPFAASIGSIFHIDAPSVDFLYGGLGGLRLGLEVMTRQLGDARERDVEVTAYVARIMHLERQLTRRREGFTAMRHAIANLAEQAREVGATHPSVVGALAGTYVANVSSIAPRIMVGGDPVCLNRDGNPERIRALLLAALRSTVLWRQVGGRRLRLILGRSRLLAASRRLLPLAEAEAQG